MSAKAELLKKNPFDLAFKAYTAKTASEFLDVALKDKYTLLSQSPEHANKLKGTQSTILHQDFRDLQVQYHKAALNFINTNLKSFMAMNPTPHQVNALLQRVVVDVPPNLFEEYSSLFSKAYHIQNQLLEHFLPRVGKWQAFQTLLNYTPRYDYLFHGKTLQVETHIGHLTRIGLVDHLHKLSDYNTTKPYFYETITYLKNYFHYPHLTSEQKAKKLIRILLNTAEDMPLEFRNYKKELIEKGQRNVSYDFLDETGVLQYEGAMKHASFLQMQILRVLRNFLNQNFLVLSLNSYDLERLERVAKEHEYRLEFYKNKFIGLSFQQGFFERIFYSQKPAISRAKMCFLLFQ